MAYTRPDVYVEEILTPDNAPQGVSTSVAAFVGAAERGPSNKAIFIDSFDSFKRIFGGALEKESMFYSVRSFFQNGGTAAYIVRLVSKAATTGVAPVAQAANVTIDSASGSDVLKFKAGYRGHESFGPAGKDLRVKLTKSSRFVSQHVANSVSDLGDSASVGDSSIQVKSLNGLREGDLLKIVDEAGPVTAYVKIVSTESKIIGGVVQHFINISQELSAALGAAASIELLAYDLVVLDTNLVELERFSDLTMNPDSDDYFETLLNDDQIGSRLIMVEDQNATFALDNTVEVDQLNVAHKFLLNGENELLNFNLADDLVGDEDIKSGLQALNAKESVNLLCVPPSLDTTGGIFLESDMPKIHAMMLEYCGNRMDMFAILDAPKGLSPVDSGDGSVGQYRSSDLGVDSYWGAMYYPNLKVIKTAGKREQILIPPSGAIAGLYSRVDALGAPNGGVASSPAGYGDLGQILGIMGLEQDISETNHGDLNVMGINCIRIVDRAVGTQSGALVLGARTLSSTLDFRYINVRRMMTYVEKSVKGLAKPYLFRNNGPRLWSELTSTIESFLDQRFANGELAGNSASEAFFVKIDATTNTADNIRQGILVGEIGLALLRPAEFIIFRFSQIQSQE